MERTLVRESRKGHCNAELGLLLRLGWLS